jgi:hypothetical protein
MIEDQNLEILIVQPIEEKLDLTEIQDDEEELKIEEPIQKL